MMNCAKFTLSLLVLLIATVMVSACSTHQDVKIPGQSNNKTFIPQGMMIFEGSVFVASTKPSPGPWQLAGWQIARNSMTVADNQVPKDCTLYPHEGVEDQWIGSCTGNTLIPKDGASRIAVMHTPPNGNTILVQVAPTPDK